MPEFFQQKLCERHLPRIVQVNVVPIRVLSRVQEGLQLAGIVADGNGCFGRNAANLGMPWQRLAVQLGFHPMLHDQRLHSLRFGRLQELTFG
jgi:hypothetical protein